MNLHSPSTTFTTMRDVICVKLSVMLLLQKWLGLQQIPRGFITSLYTVVQKLPETRLVLNLLIGN